jgi:phosphate acetyltransferase
MNEATSSAHPRLAELIARARQAAGDDPPAIGLVHPCDALALQAAEGLRQAGIARPLLIGDRSSIDRAADAAGIELRGYELVDCPDGAPGAARRATALVRSGALAALMKGSLHTDELMAAVVNKNDGLRTGTRISHAFVFDLPRYHKLLALADCVVNIAPDLRTKRDIVGNAVAFLQRLGIAEPHVGVVAAVEAVNPSIPATLDAQALVEHAAAGHWPGARVEGPFGFDNAFSAEAARVKGMTSRVAGNADLLVMPDLNAGNMLYKSFVYVGGGDCAGLVLGATVPIVLTSRADSQQARMASAALAVLTSSFNRN